MNSLEGDKGNPLRKNSFFFLVSCKMQLKATDGVFGEVLRPAQEAIVLPPCVALDICTRAGVWDYILVNVDALDTKLPSRRKREFFVSGSLGLKYGLTWSSTPRMFQKNLLLN
ncbi:hypothetical protein MKX03_007940 [Papaver bracteatum]|nr:hypothetical protein MKX03_007940 [Papaver bracteatum]